MQAVAPTIQQEAEIIRFLLFNDGGAFEPLAYPLFDELNTRIDSIKALVSRKAKSERHVAQAILTIQASKIIEQLESMWLMARPDVSAPTILNYIKRITCEASLARRHMVHPDRPITEKDCCIFDIDETLLHHGVRILSRAVVPELIAWMLELQALGYSIILMTARTSHHPFLELKLARQGIRIHRSICVPASTYDSCRDMAAKYERSKLAKKQARITLKAEEYSICLTVGNRLGDLDDVGNRYLLPEYCLPQYKLF